MMRQDLSPRIDRLTPEKRALLALRLDSLAQRAAVEPEARELSARLVAYAVPEPGEELSPNELRGFLVERLPDYMLPAEFIFLDELPRTPNGKVDLRALPEPQVRPAQQRETGSAPKDQIEKRLVDIWETLLGVSPIGVHDNFFELGGHSLLSMRLFVQVEKEFDVKLPLAVMFQDATIEFLAGKIREENLETDWPTLVPIQPQGDRIPFFCVHGQTGDILWFRDLGRQLAPDQPLYGLQARGLDGEQQPFDSIEAMAAHYMKVIRALQPRGPYFLGGASLGGTVAFEVAQRLLAEGQEVPLLVMFDHGAYNVPYDNHQPQLQATASRALRFGRNFPRWLRTFSRLPSGQITGRVRRKVRLALKNARGRFQGETAAPPLIEATDMLDYADELPDHRLRLLQAHYQAIVNYHPGRYPGRITLFQAHSQPLFSTYDPDVGWKQLAEGGVEVHIIPGSHEEIFKEPNVQIMADLLRKCIETAIARDYQPSSDS